MLVRAALLACASAAIWAPAASAQDQPPLPRGFLWGVASSAVQSEGSGPAHNWALYQLQSGSEPLGRSVDFRRRYPEDIRRAASLGVNAFRLSIDWARVQPAPGRWDRRELAYYDDVVGRLRARGIRPMITLTHFDYPQWVGARGAWTDPRTVDLWLAFVRRIVGRYRDRGAIWVTFNEPFLFVVAHEVPRRPLDAAGGRRMLDHLVRAHRRAYDLIHRLDRSTRGVSATEYWLGRWGRVIAGGLLGRDVPERRLFTERVADRLDFVAIDYYFPLRAQSDFTDFVANRFWLPRMDPAGLRAVLREYHRRFPRLPLYVAESGYATDDGAAARPDGYRRCQALADHVAALQRARAEGLPVVGFNYWSLTDNYEWGSFRSRFGLWTVDARTDPRLRRRPTDAVATYRRIIRARGVPRGYRVVMRPGGFRPGARSEACLR